MIKPSDETFQPFYLNRMYDYSGPFNHAIPLAEHYGFRLVKPIDNTATQKSNPDLDYKISSLEHYLTNRETFSSPALLCHTRNTSDEFGYLNLDIYGVADSFVENLLLKSAYEILQKEKKTDLLVQINSFGSEESFSRFEGELQKFIKKNLQKFNEADQKELENNPFYLYQIKESDEYEEISDILIHRPRPVAHLSENCRIHLKELLEHLEETGLPYHLNPHLLPQSGKHAETVYSIIDTKSDEVVAYGERFSTQATTAAQHLMADEDNNVDCAAITIKLKGGAAEKYKEIKKEPQECKIYFAHSGAIAKRNTLQILSLLAEANLPVKHSVVKRSLREQLYHGERNGQFPLTLILGVKEVQDGTVIIRNNTANRQKAVPLSRMCSYLKRTLKTIG